MYIKSETNHFPYNNTAILEKKLYISVPLICIKLALVISLNPTFKTFKDCNPTWSRRDKNINFNVRSCLMLTLVSYYSELCLNILLPNFWHPTSVNLHLLRFKYSKVCRAAIHGKNVNWNKRLIMIMRNWIYSVLEIRMVKILSSTGVS